jgi:hypothetical protein
MDPKKSDISANVTKSVFESRIQLIHAISFFLDQQIGSWTILWNYIDTVFVQILKSNAHPLLHAAVVTAITNGLAPTNRNRIRIERIYRESVMNLISSHYIHKSSQKQTTSHLLYTLGKFINKWYPLPSDNDLLFLDKQDDLKIELTGYSMKRYEYLEQLEESDVYIDEISVEDKCKLINAASKVPYNYIPNPVLNIRLFDSQKGKDMLIENCTNQRIFLKYQFKPTW